MTKPRLEARLEELKHEYQLGDARLHELTQQEVMLRETLLRISGAIQVLQELSGSDPAASTPGTTSPAGGHAADDGAGADGNGSGPTERLTVP